jgi:exopolyphosphatase/guanosine-5'-triphosphate,3'-diphosphate pyrophosphatase
VSSGPVAAIDCGTNSIKLLVADFPRVLVRDSRVVRLGQGVDRTGRLAEEALARTFAAVEEFAGVIAEHGVARERIRFCATSATRDAENSEVFTDGVRARLGVAPQVLSGDEEAALVFAGATRFLRPAPAEPVLVVDIGGGSTELVLGDASGPVQAASLDIGGVRLHERRLHSDPPTAEEVEACRADIAAALDGSGVDLAAARTVVGTSGTIKTIAAGLLDLPRYDRDAVDGADLGVEATHAYVRRLVAMSVAERRALPYMHPGRADVSGAGSLIWSEVLRRTSVPRHLVSEADILYGIAASIDETS